MTTGQRLKAARKAAGITQAELADRLGISYVGVSQWENDLRNPKIETLQRIASALGIPVEELSGNEKAEKGNPFWTVDLNDKLRCVGCAYKFAEAHEEYFQWIEYPDGTLEVTDEELRELNDSTDLFLRFQLYELREKRKKDFRPNRKRPSTTGQDAPVGVSPAPGDTRDTPAAETPTEGPSEGE